MFRAIGDIWTSVNQIFTVESLSNVGTDSVEIIPESVAVSEGVKSFQNIITKKQNLLCIVRN